MYSYNILLSRIDEDGNQIILLDRDITADQAIAMMIEERAKAEKEPEIEGYNTPIKGPIGSEDFGFEPAVRPKVKKSVDIPQRETSYNKDLVKSDIKAGLKPKEIADTHGLSVNMVYQIKAEMKKNGELAATKSKHMTEDGVLQVHQDAVDLMVSQGKDDQDIFNAMHDVMTQDELTKAINRARLYEN